MKPPALQPGMPKLLRQPHQRPTSSQAPASNEAFPTTVIQDPSALIVLVDGDFSILSWITETGAKGCSCRRGTPLRSRSPVRDAWVHYTRTEAHRAGNNGPAQLSGAAAAPNSGVQKLAIITNQGPAIAEVLPTAPSATTGNPLSVLNTIVSVFPGARLGRLGTAYSNVKLKLTAFAAQTCS